MAELERKLRAIRRRLMVFRFVEWLVRSALVAMALAALYVLGARLFGWTAEPLLVAAGLLGGAVVVALGVTAFKSVSLREAALAADESLGLRERLSSALLLKNLRDPHGAVEALQRDALRHAQVIEVTRDFRFRAPRLMPHLAWPLVVFMGAYLFMPQFDLFAKAQTDAPQEEVVDEATREQMRQRDAQRIREIIREVREAEAAEGELKDGELAGRLERLSEDVALARKDRRAAIAELSRMEDELNLDRRTLDREMQPFRQIRGLQRSDMTRDIQQDMKSNRFDQASERMRDLAAQQLQNMSSGEMRNLAEEMKSLSEQLRDNPEMAQALQDAAEALEQLSQAQAQQEQQQQMADAQQDAGQQDAGQQDGSADQSGESGAQDQAGAEQQPGASESAEQAGAQQGQQQAQSGDQGQQQAQQQQGQQQQGDSGGDPQSQQAQGQQQQQASSDAMAQASQALQQAADAMQQQQQNVNQMQQLDQLSQQMAQARSNMLNDSGNQPQQQGQQQAQQRGGQPQQGEGSPSAQPGQSDPGGMQQQLMPCEGGDCAAPGGNWGDGMDGSDWRQGNMDAASLGSQGGPGGPGIGPRPDAGLVDVEFIDHLVLGQKNEGEIISVIEIDAPALRGESQVRYEQIYNTQRQRAAESMRQNEIPLGYRNAVRDYFEGINPQRRSGGGSD